MLSNTCLPLSASISTAKTDTPSVRQVPVTKGRTRDSILVLSLCCATNADCLAPGVPSLTPTHIHNFGHRTPNLFRWTAATHSSSDYGHSLFELSIPLGARLRNARFQSNRTETKPADGERRLADGIDTSFTCAFLRLLRHRSGTAHQPNRDTYESGVNHLCVVRHRSRGGSRLRRLEETLLNTLRHIFHSIVNQSEFRVCDSQWQIQVDDVRIVAVQAVQ